MKRNWQITDFALVSVEPTHRSEPTWIGGVLIRAPYRAWYQRGVPHRHGGPAIECEDGSRYWLWCGVYSRDDGPAVERADGSTAWYRDGVLHRVGGPAVEGADGHTAWYRNGTLHREDGPAWESPGGCSRWYLNGTLRLVQEADGSRRWYDRSDVHRDGGPTAPRPCGTRCVDVHREDGPATILPDGTRIWCSEGRIHREDGPAIEAADGTTMWWLHGRRHRANGPAVDWADGTVEWWVGGRRVGGARDHGSRRAEEALPRRRQRRAGAAGRGGASHGAMVAIGEDPRDATAYLVEESNLCEGMLWPNPHHPASVVICVLEQSGLDGAADELRAIVAREDERNAGRSRDGACGEPDPPAVTLRYSHDSSGPARLSDLGRIPLTVNVVTSVDGELGYDMCDYSVHEPGVRVPLSPLSRDWFGSGRSYGGLDE